MTMPLSEEALRKARLLAEARHCSVEQAVLDALDTALQMTPVVPERSAQEIAERRRRIEERLKRIDAMNIDRSVSDKDLYDRDGNPVL